MVCLESKVMLAGIVHQGSRDPEDLQVREAIKVIKAYQVNQAQPDGGEYQALQVRKDRKVIRHLSA